MSRGKKQKTTQSPATDGDPFDKRVIEACTLVAVAVVPLAYDPHNTLGFQTLKISIIRTLGLLVAAAIFAGWAARRRLPDWPASGPLKSLLTLLGVMLCASLFSLNATASFRGSPEYLQGFFTLVSCAFLFAGAALAIQTKARFDRLVATAIAASIPACLYGLLQRAGGDPSTFAKMAEGSAQTAASSLAGQPIFLAGYLIMLLPLTAWRILDGVRASRTSGRPWFQVGVAVGFVALLLQLTAAVATEKRGPFIAAVVAAFFGMVMLGAVRRRFRLIVRACIGVALVAGGLVALASLRQSAPGIAQFPVVQALARIAPTAPGGSDPYRLAIWANCPAIALPDTAFTFPDGSKDRWAPIRSVIGYGPETVAGVLTQRWLFINNGPGGSVENRLHNLFWDTWAAAGVLGVLALSWFFLSILSATGRAAGLAANRLFFASAAAAACGGAAVAGLAWGWGFAGIGFQFGLVAGAAGGYLILSRNPACPCPPDHVTRSGAAIALATGLVAHWMDAGFAFPTGSTAVLFWIFSGAAVAMAAVPATSWDDEPPSTSAPPRSSGIRSGAAVAMAGILTALILITLVHGFVHYASFEPANALDVLGAALTRIRYDQGPSWLLACVFVPAWVLFSLLLARPDARRSAEPVAGVLVISLLIGTGYAIFKAGLIAAIGPVPAGAAPLSDGLKQAAGFEFIELFFVALLIAGTLLIAMSLGRMARTETAHRPLAIPWQAALASVAGFLLVFVWLVSPPLRRAALQGRGQVLEGAGRYAMAAACYEAALKTDPDHTLTRLECGIALQKAAAFAQNQTEYRRFMERAEDVLRAGRVFGEFHFINYYLGRLYLLNAIRERDTAKRDEWAVMAREAYGRALIFAPQSEPALVDLAALEGGVGRSDDEKIALAKADAITAQLDPLPWADFYSNLSFQTADEKLKAAYRERALHYFDRAGLLSLKRSPTLAVEARQIYRHLMTEGTIRRNSGQREAAMACFMRAIEMAPDTGTWQAEAMLAQIYLDLGRPSEAAPHAAKALEIAPPDARNALTGLKAACGL